MAGKYRIELLAEISVRFHKAICLCRHVIRQSGNGGRLRTVLVHDAGIRGKIRNAPCGVADIQVVGVALARDAGVGRKYDIGLKISDNLRNAVQQLVRLIKAAVG